jgi:hypothetical protein
MSGRNKYKLSLKEGFPNSSLKNPHEVPMNVSSQHKKKKKIIFPYFLQEHNERVNPGNKQNRICKEFRSWTFQTKYKQHEM